MSFIAYVLAWTIIASLTAIICSFVGRLSRFIVNHTPLKKFFDRKNEEFYSNIARFMVEEIEKNKNVNSEVYEDDADISMVRE